MPWYSTEGHVSFTWLQLKKNQSYHNCMHETYVFEANRSLSTFFQWERDDRRLQYDPLVRHRIVYIHSHTVAKAHSEDNDLIIICLYMEPI